MCAYRSALLLPALLGALAPQEGRPEVTVTLVSDADSIAPGETFQVAALFEIEEGWHIYWKNPGDSGAPTSAELRAPAGYEVHGPLYPAPGRIPLPAGMFSFAYEQETALFFRVSAPADAALGDAIDLALEADWLACKEICFLGDGTSRLQLAVGGRGGAREDEAQALDRARERLPLPFEGVWSWEGDFRVEGGLHVGTLRLESRVPGLADFFPDPSGGLRLRSKDHASESVVHLTLETRADPSEQTARGVLRIRGEEQDRFYEINVPTKEETNR